MEMIEARKKNSNSRFWNLVFPTVALVGVLVTDHIFFSGVMLTPTCNFIMLAILSMRLKPAPMFFWAAMFLCSTLFVLMFPEFAMKGPMDAHANMFIRSIGATTGAALAVFLCIHRSRLTKDHGQMLQLLKRMPVPFVLSDEHGEILFINEQASALLKVTNKDALGDSFFSLLENVAEKGTSIQRYLSVFDTKSSQELVSKFRPRTNPDALFNGHSILVETAGLRRMVTIISPSQDDAPVVSPAAAS
jgi:PAS domain-containing protein